MLLIILLLTSLAPPPWTHVETVGVGVVWRHRTWVDDGVPRSISVLDVDPKVAGVRIGFARASGREKTSALGGRAVAVAAVNGGFFAPDGTTQGTLRIAGVDAGAPSPSRTSALCVEAKGQTSIRTDSTGAFPGVASAMAAGPRLVRAGVVPANSWSDAIHPRTAVGVTKDGVVRFVTVDGRTKRAKGLTLAAMGALMIELGCVEALNLDGGGSTTMWVGGEPFGGIVNRPSDNRRFDQAGERVVGNAVVIHARDVAEADDREALLDGVWQRSRAGTGFMGDGYAIGGEAASTCWWGLTVVRPGRYELSFRWPRGVDLPGEIIANVDGVRRVVKPRGTGDWVSAGVVVVKKGRGPLTVEIELQSAGKGVVADAVRLTEN